MNKSIRGKYAIVGVGNTTYGRVPGVSALDHNVDAISRALADCGLRTGDVDAVLTKAPSSDFQMLWSAKVADAIGVVPAVTATLDQAGASNIGLITYAIMCMELGMCSTAVISYGDNPLTGTRSFYSRPRGDDAAYGLFGAPSGYALIAQRHMELFGTTSEQLAAVSINARKNASKNPNAQFQQEITLADHQASRFVAEPLRLLDCCPVSDGGAAIVVTSAERARDLSRPPAYILGVGQSHPSWDIARRDECTTSGAVGSGKMAFEMAGIGPSDVDFAELYDCFSIVPIVTLEDYGFCKKGEGGAFVQGGRIELDGELPINTSGGLLAETGMPGMQHVVEGVRQIRREGDARQVKNSNVGIVSGQGGIMTTHATMILGADRS
jgi:acetyl-CoA acetyltransferase